MLEGFQAIDEALKHHEAPLTAEEEVELQRIEKGEALAVELSNYVNLVLLVAKVSLPSFLETSRRVPINMPMSRMTAGVAVRQLARRCCYATWSHFVCQVADLSC